MSLGQDGAKTLAFVRVTEQHATLLYYKTVLYINVFFGNNG